MKKPTIIPSPGYILCEKYVENKIFVSAKESAGEDQKSKVIEVGLPALDDNGHKHESPCKIGDIIIHADSNKTFTYDNILYRMVHFTEVHGILWEEKETSK